MKKYLSRAQPSVSDPGTGGWSGQPGIKITFSNPTCRGLEGESGGPGAPGVITERVATRFCSFSAVF